MIEDVGQYPNDAQEQTNLELSYCFPDELVSANPDNLSIYPQILAFISSIIPNEHEFADIMRGLKMP